MGGKLEAPEGKLLCWLNSNSGEQRVGPKLIVDNSQIYRVTRALTGESGFPENNTSAYTVFDAGKGQGVVVVKPSRGGLYIKPGLKIDLGVFTISGT